MSQKLTVFAGLLVATAVATPHLGRVISPLGHASATVRVADSLASPPVVVAAAVVAPPRIETAPATPVMTAADPVPYGDAKSADFDPDHPPADMGEPG